MRGDEERLTVILESWSNLRLRGRREFKVELDRSKGIISKSIYDQKIGNQKFSRTEDVPEHKFLSPSKSLTMPTFFHFDKVIITFLWPFLLRKSHKKYDSSKTFYKIQFFYLMAYWRYIFGYIITTNMKLYLQNNLRRGCQKILVPPKTPPTPPVWQ